MSALAFYDIPANHEEDLKPFYEYIKDYQNGVITPDVFKAIRVAYGVYEQREADTYMIRIRCAAGGITPRQLIRVAELGEQFGSSDVHYTTRQEVQIHDVSIEDVPQVFAGLTEVGLSSRGGGGNTVRNILCPGDSGINADEIFDVEPHIVALTSKLIAQPDSWNLPRKLKISFNNTIEDRAYVKATCIGFSARIQDGVEGFHVTVGGGMGARPLMAKVLMDFIPSSELYRVTMAIKQLFDEHGNRKNRTTSRLKFLVDKMGIEDFKALFETYYAPLRQDPNAVLDIKPLAENSSNLTEFPSVEVDETAFADWKSKFVKEQKQAGLFSVNVSLLHGDQKSKACIEMCKVLEQIGENTIRCERSQNALLRNIPEAALPMLYKALQASDNISYRSALFSNVINCTGAQTCKLGICLSRGLAKNVQETLAESDLNLEAMKDLKIHLSGCTNSCGMHHVGDLGMNGGSRKNNGTSYPVYNVMAGGDIVKNEGATYAKRLGWVPAKRATGLIQSVLGQYQNRGADASFRAYLEEEGYDYISEQCKALQQDIPDFEDEPGFYTDHGAPQPFSLNGLGTQAECSAGTTELIKDHSRSILAVSNSLREGGSDMSTDQMLRILLLSSARLLLTTQGEQERDENKVFVKFSEMFVKTGYIDGQCESLFSAFSDPKALEAVKDEILAFGEKAIAFYESLGDSLKLPAKA